MVANFFSLLKNYRFPLKFIELLFACISLVLLSHEENYLIPRWLWLIYCTNSLTYIIVLTTMLGSYVVEEDCLFMDSAFSDIGVLLHLVGGITAIVRSTVLTPADANNDSYELPLGIIFIVNATLMLCQVIWTIYTDKRSAEAENDGTED